MNERIKELAEQSGYGARWTTTEQFEQFMEKFAEVIVLECVECIKPFRWTTTEQFEQFMEKFAQLIVRECSLFVDDPTSVAVKKMKEHFGVED